LSQLEVFHSCAWPVEDAWLFCLYGLFAPRSRGAGVLFLFSVEVLVLLRESCGAGEVFWPSSSLSSPSLAIFFGILVCYVFSLSLAEAFSLPLGRFFFSGNGFSVPLCFPPENRSFFSLFRFFFAPGAVLLLWIGEFPWNFPLVLVQV